MSSLPTTAAGSGPGFKDYPFGTGYYDEYLDERGQPRPHWEAVASKLAAIDDASWTRRRRQRDKLIRDYGITYNVYGEDSSTDSPWSMDLIPHCMTQSEMQGLESKLAQRAHLLNLILEDVYGRQTMLQTGKMHPYLVFANPAFQRACHGLLARRHKHIQLYAADIARAPDGNWWVIADRVEAASGLGYTLENRAVASRVLPQIMAETEILPLQPFIHQYCAHIESLVPAHIERPSIAMLTAGPHNETYFEQSFLSRNLGFHLVEGGDLTVRSNRLFIKTVGGVEPVDVLLRRIDTEWCDPLELRNDSLLGIPGLVNAVRQGNLVVVNALGSGFVETPSMLAFLPGFCRNFLGETLDIPSVATWWCGQKREMDYVIDNIDGLVIKPTFWSPRARSYFGPQLSGEQKSELIERIKSAPEQFCGQEIVSHGTIPTLHTGRLEPRHFQMRVFMVPDGNGWKIMPGGLVRCAREPRDVVVSFSHGGASKDGWVLRDQPVAATQGQAVAPIRKQRIRRDNTELPSRTADNLFWLGRYLERSESHARLIRTICDMLLDDAGGETRKSVLPFIDQLVPPEIPVSTFTHAIRGHLKLDKVEHTVIASIFDRDTSGSLIASLGQVERSARLVKERLSTDTWKRVVALAQMIESASGKGASVYDSDLILQIDAILHDLSSLVGNLAENMTRTFGWRFLQIGRRIERGINISNLLHSACILDLNHDETLLDHLLSWADSSITYRRRYLNTLQCDRVLDVVCFDAANPRSLAYQCERIGELVKPMPRAEESIRHPIEQAMLRLNSRIGLTNPESLLKGKERASASAEAFFATTSNDLMLLSIAIEEQFFAHTTIEKDLQPQMLLL